MRRKKKIDKKYLLILLLLILVMIFFTTFRERGIIHIYRLSKERDQIKALNNNIEEQNRNLKTKIYSLKKDRSYIEGIARQGLGLAKEDEIIYQFKSPKNPRNENLNNKKKVKKGIRNES
ncbi:MAG: septum formation initiator family protein [Thermodesulfobacteriota bacterium]